MSEKNTRGKKVRNDFFSVRLSQARRETGLSQEKFAEDYDFNVASLRSWEQAGGREPDLTTVVKLANILHLSTDYLLGRDDDSNVKMRDVASYIGVSQPAAAKLESLAIEHDQRTLPLNGLIMDARFNDLIYQLWSLHEEALLVKANTTDDHKTTDCNKLTERVIRDVDLLEYDLDRVTTLARRIFSRICMVDEAIKVREQDDQQRAVAKLKAAYLAELKKSEATD